MNRVKRARRGAMVMVASVMFASPAMASLVVNNFMEADVSVADACFTKIAGDDNTSYTGAGATDPLAGFDGTNNTVTVAGVDLLEEKLSIRGMKGDRVYYTDVVRYQNNCDIDLNVTLIAQGASATGDWNDRSAAIYISNSANPTGLPGDLTSDWNSQAILVTANTGAFAAPNNQTGTVTVPAGSEVQGAVVVSAGVNASTDPALVGTVNWIATAEHQN